MDKRLLRGVMVCVLLGTTTPSCETFIDWEGLDEGRSSPCAHPAPSWVFCSEFEETDPKAIWNDNDGNPDESNALVTHPGPQGLAGNHVMRLAIPGSATQTRYADLVKVLPSTYDRLFVRWYAMFESGFEFSSASHVVGLHAGVRDLLGAVVRPNGSDWFLVSAGAHTEPLIRLTAYYPGMYQGCPGASSCVPDAFPCLAAEGVCTVSEHRAYQSEPPVPRAGVWYCIEQEVRAGAPTSSATGADGALSLWVDGSPVGEWKGLWLRNTGDLELGILWIQMGGMSPQSSVLLDHVVVSRERIGCLN